MLKKISVLRVCQFFLAIVIMLGIGLRYVNLGNFPFWIDETTNSFHSAGYSKIEIKQQFAAATNQFLRISDLRRFQYSRNTERTAKDTIVALATGEPQSPPVFYLLERSWDQLWSGFEPQIALKRTLPVTLSLLGLPAMYWLCWEIFESSITAWVGMTLLFVSPLQFTYAREMRMYSLWSVELLYLSAIFLWALKQSSWQRWSLYTFAVTLSLYTFPFTSFTVMAHGGYLAIMHLPKHGWKPSWSTPPRIQAFTIAVTTSFTLYLPWILCILAIDENDMLGWREAEKPISTLIKSWVSQFIKPFFNASIYENSRLTSLLILAVVIASTFHFATRRHRLAGLFLLLLASVPFLCLAIPDIMVGGIRSTIDRYLLGSSLSLCILVAGAIGHGLNLSRKHYPNLRSSITAIALIFLLSTGLLSCYHMVQMPQASHHFDNENNREIKTILATHPEAPLLFLINDQGMASNPVPVEQFMLTLAYDLEDTQLFQIANLNDLSTSLYCRTRDSFIFTNSSEHSIKKLAKFCMSDIRLVSQGKFSLWSSNSVQ